MFTLGRYGNNFTIITVALYTNSVSFGPGTGAFGRVVHISSASLLPGSPGCIWRVGCLLSPGSWFQPPAMVGHVGGIWIKGKEFYHSTGVNLALPALVFFPSIHIHALRKTKRHMVGKVSISFFVFCFVCFAHETLFMECAFGIWLKAARVTRSNIHRTGEAYILKGKISL